MAKIVNGSLVLDPNDHIDFVDNQGASHVVYWDDILERFLFNGDVAADQFIGATNSVVAARNPQPSDSGYNVPTIWVNSTTNYAFLLVTSAPGNAVWQFIGSSGGSGHELDYRITINDGLAPSQQEAFDMWVQIDPE